MTVTPEAGSPRTWSPAACTGAGIWARRQASRQPGRYRRATKMGLVVMLTASTMPRVRLPQSKELMGGFIPAGGTPAPGSADGLAAGTARRKIAATRIAVTVAAALPRRTDVAV